MNTHTLPRQPGIVCLGKRNHCFSFLFLLRLLAGVGGVLLCPGLARAPTVTLAWNASPADPSTVAGYNLYWGPSSHSYTNMLFFSGTTGAIGNLAFGTTYYFNVTAVGTNTLESEYDGEAVTTTPLPPPVRPPPPTNLRITVVQ